MARVWDESLAPPYSSFVDLSRGRVRYRAEGPPEAESVLFLPGMSYPMEVFGPIFEAMVGEGFRAVSFDLYGRGFSSYRGGPLAPADLAAQALELLDHLEFEGPVRLVSLSNGDLISCTFAATHPKRTRALTLIAPSGIDRRTMNLRMRLGTLLPLVGTLFEGRLRRRYAGRMRSHRDLLPPEASDFASEFYELSIGCVEGNPSFPAAVMAHLRGMPRPTTFRARLRELAGHDLTISMLEFAEERDATGDGIAIFRETLPAIDCRMVERGSHLGLVEHPDLVIPYLLDLWGEENLP